jgi:predicted Zn-ribbon and HTH transcriptional regulator
MSISMERFASEGNFTTYDAFHAPQRVSVFQLQCRSCGFEPEDSVVAPRLCPKCRSEAWERFAKPGIILENANRF